MMNINIQIFVICVKVSLEISVTHFIEVFEFSKVLILFLNSIIRQMNKFIVDCIQIIFSTTGSDIAIFVEITFKLLIYTRH